MSEQPRPQTLGERIKHWRDRRGLSQRELARRARVDVAWISRLESGERHNLSLEAAYRIARVLQVSLDYLAGAYNGDMDLPRLSAEAALFLAGSTPLPTATL